MTSLKELHQKFLKENGSILRLRQEEMKAELIAEHGTGGLQAWEAMNQGLTDDVLDPDIFDKIRNSQ